MSVRGAAIWAMGAQYVAFIIQFATSIVIARFFLLPEEVGLFSLAFSITAMLAALQDFGIVRYVVGKRDLGPADIRASFSVALLFGFAVALIVASISWPAARFYEDMRLMPLLLIIAGSFLLVPFAILPTALLQRDMNFRALFMLNVGAAAANAGVSIALAAAGYSAQALAWGAIAQQVARAVIGQWQTGGAVSLSLTLGGLKPILGFGGYSSLLAISGTIGMRSPELIIGRLLSFGAVGLWARAIGLADQLRYLLSGAIGSVFYPAFARLRDQGEDLAPPYLRVVSAYTAILWPAMMMLAVTALPLILILYGENWEGVAPILVFIALSELFLAAIPLQMEIPILLGRMRLLLGLNLIDTAASVAFILVGALWSLEGAAASRIAWGAVWWLIYAALLRALIGLSWRSLADIYWRSLVVSLASVAPVALVFWQVAAPREVPFLWLAGGIAAGGLSWLAALYLVRHPARHEMAGFLELVPIRRRPPIAAE